MLHNVHDLIRVCPKGRHLTDHPKCHPKSITGYLFHESLYFSWDQYRRRLKNIVWNSYILVLWCHSELRGATVTRENPHLSVIWSKIYWCAQLEFMRNCFVCYCAISKYNDTSLISVSDYDGERHSQVQIKLQQTQKVLSYSCRQNSTVVAIFSLNMQNLKNDALRKAKT